MLSSQSNKKTPWLEFETGLMQSKEGLDGVNQQQANGKEKITDN